MGLESRGGLIGRGRKRATSKASRRQASCAGWFALARGLPVFAAVATLLVFGTAPPTESAPEPMVGWDYPLVVNDDGRGVRQTDPAVTVDTGGALHAVWVDYRHSPEGGDVFYARLPAGSSVWAANRRVTSGPATYARTGPSVAVDSQGSVHVVWSEARGAAPDIRHSMLLAGTQVWTPAVRVNDDHTTAAQIDPVVVPDLWGSAHIVWVDYRAGSAALYHGQRLVDGIWMPNKRVTERVQGVQEHPALVCTKRGDIYAVWQEARDKKTDVYASRLPPGSSVWWPPYELSASPSSSREHHPSVATDSSGAVHAVWRDDGAGILRVATLRAGEEMWDRDRIAYVPERGGLTAAAIGAGPGPHTVVVWGESRPEGDRLYSGVLEQGLLRPERVDATPLVVHSEAPVVAIDRQAGAHAVWVGTDREGQPDVVHGRGALPSPTHEPIALEGWLQYRYGEWNCAGDGYMVADCEGNHSPFIVPVRINLDPFLGSYVAINGRLLDDDACIHVRAGSVKFAAAPCSRGTGSLTGVLTGDAGSVDGAHVFLGDVSTYTGRSGRFFFNQVDPGRYDLTATLGCALPLSAGEVRINDRPVTSVDRASFVRGEVIEDARIDIRDMVRVTAQYKTEAPFHPPCSDQDGDGDVDLADVVVVAASYGTTGPTEWAEPERVGGAAEGDLWCQGSEGVSSLELRTHEADCAFAWEVEVAGDASSEAPLDMDEELAGVQPFDARVPAGAWFVENSYDPATRVSRLAATLVAPAECLEGEALLGRMQHDGRTDSAPRVRMARLLDRSGRPVAGGVVADFRNPAREIMRLWMPWLGH